MNNLISKLNLYEVLAMLIPGSALTFELCALLHKSVGTYGSCCSTSPDSMYILVFFVIAYIVGCIYHVFLDWWWSPLKNNPTHIAYIYHSISKDTHPALTQLLGDQDIEGKGCFSYLQCRCALLRLLWMAISIIFYPICALMKCLCIECCCSSHGSHEKQIFLDKYYTAYYYAERNRGGAPYGFIEGQIALCRNMILPVILVPFTLNGCLAFAGECPCIGTICGIAAVVLFVFTVLRQEKLYRCIMEDYEYTKRMEK